MGFGSVISSPRGNLTLQQALGLANVYLEYAGKAQDTDIALVLCHDTELALSQAKKGTKSGDDQTMRQEIATSYLGLGRVLAIRGYISEAQAIYKKAEKLGVKIQDHPVKQSVDTKSIALSVKPDVDSAVDAPPVKDLSIASKIKRGVNDIAIIPAYVFAENVRPPMVVAKLPEPDERLLSTPQLAYCLGLLRDSHELDDILEPTARNWLQIAENDEDEHERLKLLSLDVIRTFKKEEIKDAKAVAEVVCLAPVIERDIFRDLLRTFYDGIDHSGLLDIHQLQGLAQLIQGADTDYLDSDDLVKILGLLTTRLKETHQQSPQHIYQLTLAASYVLDAMADTKVEGLDRETLHEPLSSYMDALKVNSEPYLVYQAAYACQALLCVPDNESLWQATFRRTGKVIQGVSGLVSAVKGLDLNGFMDGLKDIQQGIAGASEVVQVVVTAFDGVKSMTEGGQGFLEGIKEGLSFKRKCAWYSALRGADTLIRGGEFATFKQLVCEAPCRLDPAFQWGVCQRLGQVASSTVWDARTRRSAAAFLGEMYRNEADWGHQTSVKEWILIILMRLSSSTGSVQQYIQTLLQELESNADVARKSFMQANRGQDPKSYPLNLALPPLASPTLLDRVQNKPDVEGGLRQIRKQRLKERGDAVYIQPQAKANIQASDDERFPLMERVNEFLGSNQKVFLLLGDSGAGKSTFNRQLECDLWNRYKKATGRVPLHISLPAIDKPEQDMIAKQLRKAEFTESEIRELKVHRKFILICDGYDESQQTHNLYMSNRLNQPGEWDAQMLISCRSEYLGSDYRDRFQPGDRNHRSDPGQFQEAVITPFTPDQVHDYIKQYVTVHQPLWETKEYEQALDIIPGLKDLVKNPFLMTLSLEVLPRMVDPGERLSATQITRVALYDQFIVHWLERGKKRLSEKELSSQAKAAFESLVDEGFTQNGIDFLKKLAVAIYKEQGGQPIVKYSRFKDEGTWKAEFFSRDDEKLLLREACPLTRSGNQYRFVHRSLLEYGLALAIHDPRDWKESTMPAAALGRRGSTSSAYSFNVDVATEEATAPIEQVPDITSPLSWRYFINEPSILQFLSERSQQEPIFRKLLLDYIEYSKTDEKWRKAAANAITILTRSGEKFHGADLSNIRIPGADLSYGMFDSANFQGADLRKVTLRGAWLRQVKLSQAQMSGVHFGELPFVKEDDSVWSCAYSPDGNLLAISLSNGDIKVYSTSMWELEHTLKGHDDEVGRVVFSPNGDHLLSGGLDCTARIWDVETESCIHTLTGHDEEVTCVAYSPEGDTIATASEDKTVRVWNASTGNCQFILIGHTSCTFSVAYSPNRCHIASGSGDRTVRIWDIETGACLHTLKGHEYQVRELAYSPQGDRIASGSDDKTLRLWDVETGTCCRIISAHGSAIYTLAYSLQGDVIACGGNDGTVQLWDPETGTCRQILTGHSLDVRCIVFSPKEGHIASASADSTVRLWEAGSGGSSQVPAGHMDGVLSVKYSPQGHRVASSGRDGTIRLWDVETGVCHQILASHTSWVSSIAFSPQGDIVVSAGHDGTLKMWDMGTGACLQTFTCHDETIETVAYSPRGDQVASGDISGSVQLWNVETGECRFILIGHEYRVAKVVYSPNGNHLASSGDHTVRLWSTESGDCLHALSGHEGSVNKIAFSPRGDLIASASDDQSVMLWEVDTGDCRAVLTGHDDEINSMAYSPSGDHIASGCNGGIVKLWSVATGDRLHDLTGHTDAISSIVFSLNGNELVTGGDDRAVRLWDVASGQCRAAIQDLNKYVVCIDWSPVSTTDCFVVGCGDGSVLRWQVIGEGDQRHVRMRWGSTNLFTAKDASIQGVSGLSQLNKRFLVQRGAVIEPLDRLREMSKLIGMVSVVSGFKQPSGLVPESVPSTRSSVE